MEVDTVKDFVHYCIYYPNARLNLRRKTCAGAGATIGFWPKYMQYNSLYLFKPQQARGFYADIQINFDTVDN